MKIGSAQVTNNGFIKAILSIACERVDKGRGRGTVAQDCMRKCERFESDFSVGNGKT